MRVHSDAANNCNGTAMIVLSTKLDDCGMERIMNTISILLTLWVLGEVEVHYNEVNDCFVSIDSVNLERLYKLAFAWYLKDGNNTLNISNQIK